MNKLNTLECNTIEKLRAELAEKDALLAKQHEAIAILGTSCRFPGGCESLEDLHKAFLSGHSLLNNCPKDRMIDHHNEVPFGGFMDHINLFDARFFSISPKEAQSIDPQQRISLELAWKAIETSGIDPSTLVAKRGGVFMGASGCDHALNTASKGETAWNCHAGTGTSISAIAGRISYFLGWHGPAMTIDTACSSSLVALHQALTALRKGECDFALVGAISLINHSLMHTSCTRANMLSESGACLTFDARADGYARSEGGAMLFLKRLSDAETDRDIVLATVNGSCVEQDGKRSGLTVPNGNSQRSVMQRALKDAKITPTDVSYVEAHGTGTPLGDPIEMDSISSVFSSYKKDNNPLIVNSAKTNLGHMEAAAGLGGILKVICQLSNKVIYRHPNFKIPSPHIDWKSMSIQVPIENREWLDSHKTALINSFGFTGTIASVVVSAPKQGPIVLPFVKNKPQLFTLSARSKNSLLALLNRYKKWLKNTSSSYHDICLNSQVTRKHHELRISGVVCNTDDIENIIETSIEKIEDSVASKSKKSDIVYIFEGNFHLDKDTIWKLTKEIPSLADHLKDFANREFPHRETSIEDCKLVIKNLNHDYDDVLHFIFQYSLYENLVSWGVKPRALVCDYQNLLVAAIAAGMLEYKTAIALLLFRKNLNRSNFCFHDISIQRADLSLYLKGENKPITEETLSALLSRPFPPTAAALENATDFIFKNPLWISLSRLQCFKVEPEADDVVLEDSGKRLCRLMGDLYLAGVQIDWQAINTNQIFNRIGLPLYQFDYKTY